MSGIKQNVAEIIGNTPLVQLNKITEGCKGRVVVKLEGENPAKSVKDRLGLAIVEYLEAEKGAKPGDWLLESSSGNTGVALAMVSAVKGYNSIICMSETMSRERRMCIHAYGGHCFLTPASKGIKGAMRLCKAIHDHINGIDNPDTLPSNVLAVVEGKPGGKGFLTAQFETPCNAAYHRKTTGVEIWNDTDGKVDYVVSGVGTGGTVCGVAQCLKLDKQSSCKVIAVEPTEADVLTQVRHEGVTVADAKPKGKNMVQGIGAGFVPPLMCNEGWETLVDIVTKIPSLDALECSRKLASTEGIFCGMSSGAIVQAALDLAKQPENDGKLIVAIVPSYGERYLSTAQWKHLKETCDNLPVLPESWF